MGSARRPCGTGSVGTKPTTKKQELAALRKENADLRRSCEILKAASAFFAEELDPTRRRY
ncbi:hypothetical protein [Streptomyces goshikiensis]|uniref:hypothetical protein n=1 Tax=Streptomyces goshikiensis TaxID=1942 RepID=UPI0036C0878E